MTDRLLDPYDPAAQATPERLHRQALDTNKQLLQIILDEAGGYPEHAWGFIQWSLRPYEQRQGCDGTVDLRVHLIGLQLCTELGLDYATLYAQAYAWRDDPPDTAWITEVDWDEVAAHTTIPPLSTQALKNLLYDLTEINNHSFIEVLVEAFAQLGYDMTGWED